MLFGLAVLILAVPAASFRAVAPRSSLRMAIAEGEEGALKKLTLTSSSGAEATVFTMGACVTSFKAPSEVLFVRPDAKFDGSKPISGGLPHCFPQFGPGEIQQHGFARNVEWNVLETNDGDSPSVTMELVESDYTLGMWDNKFRNLYTVTVGKDNTLSTKLEVTNTGDASFSFTGALHSYFQVADIDDTTVNGDFQGAMMLDRMKDPPARVEEERRVLTIEEETDRCYEGVAGKVEIADVSGGRTIVIDNAEGWSDTVLWNPYGDEGMGAKNFVCVESAQVTEPVTVEPGASWVGEMTLSLRKA